MAQPGAVMIAVGAGHLAGTDSVLELLKKDGYQRPPRPIDATAPLGRYPSINVHLSRISLDIS